MSKIIKALSSCFSSNKEIQLNSDTPPAWLSVIFPIVLFDFWQSKKDWIESNQPIFGPMLENTVKTAKQISYEEKIIAKNKKLDIKKYLSDLLADDCILVIPTIHDLPPFRNTEDKELLKFGLKASEYTCIASLGGLPEISLPLIQNTRGNINLSFLSAHGTDLDLLSFMDQIYSFLKK